MLLNAVRTVKIITLLSCRQGFKHNTKWTAAMNLCMHHNIVFLRAEVVSQSIISQYSSVSIFSYAPIRAHLCSMLDIEMEAEPSVCTLLLFRTYLCTFSEHLWSIGNYICQLVIDENPLSTCHNVFNGCTDHHHLQRCF